MILKICIKILIVGFFLMLSFVSNGQSGVIKGTLLNKYTNESIINTEVTLILNDSITKITKTDSEGFFTITQINPCKYKVKVLVNNYNEVFKKKVIVKDVRTCYMFLKLEPVQTNNKN